jgi:hypothetical protein
MRDLVDMEARMLFEPRLNVGMLVGGVVVVDEMADPWVYRPVEPAAADI